MSGADARSWTERWRRRLHTPVGELLGLRRAEQEAAPEVMESVDSLPEPLRALIAAVVDRTRLWRSEKREVERELVAHFHDALAGGATPDEASASFGDVRRAARLIRRAKKRGRPLPWRAARWTVIACLGVIGLYLALGVRFLIGRPSPHVDYLAPLTAPALAVEEPDRAWPLYRAALLRLDGYPQFERLSREPRPGEPGWDEAAAFLERSKDALAIAREAAQRPALGFPVGFETADEDRVLWPDGTASADEDGDMRMLVYVQLPHLAELRRLAKAAALDVHRAAAGGDGATVLADLQLLLAIARHVRETPFYITDLVSLAVATLAMRTAGEVLTFHPESMTDAQLHDLAHMLAAEDATLAVRLESERAMLLDIAQHVYTDDGHGDGRLTLEGLKLLEMVRPITWVTEDSRFDVPSPLVECLLAPGASLIAMSRREFVAEVDTVMALCEADASRPLWEPGAAEADKYVAAWSRSTWSMVRHLPLGLLLPAITRGHVSAELARMERDGVLVAIAAELHRRRHGAWPASLDEMIPRLLPAAPIDRFDGRSMRYALVDAAPRVYSVGADRDDDGGRPASFDGPDFEAARRWVPVEEPAREMPGASGHGAAAPAPIPDGDWIIWPRQRKPIYERD